MFRRASAVRRLSKPDRFDLHVSQTLYATSALEPFTLALWLFSGDVDGISGGPRLAVCLIWGTHTVLCMVLLRRRLEALRDGAVPSVRGTVPVLAATAAVVFLGLALHPWGALPDEATGRMLANVALMFVAGPLAVGWTARRASGAFVLTALGAGLCAGLAGASPGLLLTTGLIALVGGAFIGASFTFSAWTMKVVREIDRAREVEARLAVAEERLRFARDLHDVVMRDLSVIALKTELSIEAVLTMENDGVLTGRDEEPHGNGLAGIRDRLSSLGGRMEARVLPGGRFRLSVRLPADERRPAEAG